MWVIRAGRNSEADSLFLQDGMVALGWNALPDLTTLEPEREAFVETFATAYNHGPDDNIATTASQPYRFVHELNVGDIVLYPRKVDRRIYFGRVTGGYQYDPTKNAHFPHMRSVEWMEGKDRPRSDFSQGALSETNSSLTVFNVKTYAEEFGSSLAGEVSAPPVGEDPTVALVAEEIEETTRDFILKTLSKELKGHPFAHFFAHLLNVIGYRTRISPEGPDSGIDIVAHKDELGFEPPIIKVQVKSTEGKVGRPAVQSLYGTVRAKEHGLVVALGGYTTQALDFERNNTNLRLIDGEDLLDLMLTHYESFDPRYKALMPLKQVYVPQSPTE
jgi:restriction system protein